MGERRRPHVLVRDVASFTKSYGEGFQLRFRATWEMPQPLRDALEALPTVRVEVNERSLLSLVPAFRGSKHGCTFYVEERDAEGRPTVFAVKGRHPGLEARLTSRSFANIPVDLRFFHEDNGVLQVSTPTQEQLDGSDSTEPAGKPNRRAAS